MNVLITGVSKGIGAELLNCCMSNPKIEKIFACSSSNQLKNQINSKVQFIYLDFLNDASFENLTGINNIPIHILINNAGFLINHQFNETSIKDLKTVFEVNFFGPYRLIQCLFPSLKEGKAHIVNIGSMGGFQGSSKFPGLSAYSSSKAALANLTECLAQEFKDIPINVNCLALGSVDTEMLQKAFPGYRSTTNTIEMAELIIEFSIGWGRMINGKVIPISKTEP